MNTNVPRAAHLVALVALSVTACGGNNTDPKSAEPVVSEEAAVAADAVETEVEGAEGASERTPAAPAETGTELQDNVEPKPTPQAPDPDQP